MAAAAAPSSEKNWLPVESNPEVSFAGLDVVHAPALRLLSPFEARVSVKDASPRVPRLCQCSAPMQVMNAYAEKLGFPTDKFQFHDVSRGF